MARAGASWARGPLRALPFLLGARRVLTSDGEAEPRPLAAAAAAADAGAWAVLQVVAGVVAAAAGAALSRAGREPAPQRPIPAAGTVVYLRTDIELASADLLAGGSVAHTSGILTALVRRGHRLRYLTTGTVAGTPPEAVEQRLPVFRPANLSIELAELVSGLRQSLVRLPRDEQVAFVYQRYSLDNLAGLVLARRLRVPLVLEANASEAGWRRQWSRLQYGRLADACERLLLNRADRIAVVSENAARTLTSAGADRDRLRIVPNGVDVERFASAAPHPLPFPEGSVVVAFSGLFYPWHGVRFLAAAFGEVYRAFPQARLLLVGDGEHRALARELLVRGGAIEAAQLTGLVPMDEVPGYLAAADILVTPHAPEPGFIGSPIKLFEYLASGRAIVASRVAQLGEVLDDGRTALLVEPGDEDALAAAILRLCRDPKLRARLGAAAQKEARLRHSWDARLAQILD